MVAVVDMTRVRPLEQDMILLVQASHLSAATADRLAAAPEDSAGLGVVSAATLSKGLAIHRRKISLRN